MKKFFIAFALFAATSVSVFAQDEESNKPEAGSIGFTFGVNNLFGGGAQWFNQGLGQTNTLLFRYYLADNMAARVGLAYTRSGNTTTNLVNGVETTDKNSESSFDISLGGQLSLGSAPKLEPYIGADLVIGRGSASEYFRSDVVATEGGTVGDFFERTDNFGATMRVGLIPVVGFNYYFSKNFAIGAEFGWGYMASFTSGGSFDQSQRTGTVTTLTDGESNLSTRTGDFGNFGRGMLAVSVFF
ncbi:MAG: hypothetical protein ACK4ND_19460 [Cytophagaceae bacterium]